MDWRTSSVQKTQLNPENNKVAAVERGGISKVGFPAQIADGAHF